MSKAKELLKELVSCRRFLMSQLADLAEEEGDEWLAKAWRWMRDNNKFPSPRVTPKGNGMVVKGGKKIKQWYGWSFNDAFGAGGPTSMPYRLLGYGLIKANPYPSEEEALEVAARAIANWFYLHNGI